eukprot:CAMPEP_0167755064 /NCGR_PEP_ID=MMETSP0110_2-20121227/8616_1 /TAXON_ID=629695 /ORGANISM="Gymnochlora sp., Strain CCMP2014" /LENGTH=437 /DNA_ID=CAMNT_0007641009 /DNA_START=239 /DNA_END=1552 /DNA_ORIENTATION=-
MRLGDKRLREYIVKDKANRNRRCGEDIFSRVWLTYREAFPPLPKTNVDTDAGWGCMLRTTQMMMCQGLIHHYLGRGWKLERGKTPSPRYLMILRWFLDYDSPECPYSVHNLMSHASCVDKKAGQWFGPQAACVVMSRAHDKHLKSHITAGLPLVHMETDGTIYLKKILQLISEREIVTSKPKSRKSSDKSSKIAKGQGSNTINDKRTKEGASVPVEKSSSLPLSVGSTSARKEVLNKKTFRPPLTTDAKSKVERKVPEWERIIHSVEGRWRPIIILIPVRLGVDNINPSYYEGLRECLRLPQSLGFVGGKPKSSLYFLGFQDNRLIHLDPHTIHRSIVLGKSFKTATFHCRKLNTIEFTQLDPSLAIGFYCREKDDFIDFWRSAERLSQEKYPPFRSAISPPTYKDLDFDVDADIRSPGGKSAGSERTGIDDGFVLL